MKSEEQTDLYELAIDIFYEGGIKNAMNKIEQYAELRIQQEREKWKEETKWISVKDELPKLTEENDYGRFSKPMLCLHSDGHLEDCQLTEGVDEDDEPYWSYLQDGELCETVTHWMNIPILPNSNQE